MTVWWCLVLTGCWLHLVQVDAKVYEVSLIEEPCNLTQKFQKINIFNNMQ